MAIVESTFPDVPLTSRTITERVLEGIDPAGVVLIDGPTGRQLTGAQFIGGVKSLAGGLTARGYGAGRCVAVLAPNLPEYCVVFHAVAWAGGTVTTINPTYTAHEVHHQLKDAGADVLVTIGLFAPMAKEAADGTGVKEIVVIGDAPESTVPLTDLMGAPVADQVAVDLDDHVVVLPYSSDTTGLPKGVMLTHRNLVVNIDQVLCATTIRRGERTVAFLPFFHIYGMQVLQNMYLAGGGCLVTMPRFDLEAFLALCEKHRTPRLYVVPPIAIALARHPAVDRYDLSAVRQVNSGAAPLGGDVAEAVGRRLGTLATQGYGMTELSPVSHMTPIDAPRVGSSGVTVANTECRVVDTDTGHDVEPGGTGELWVRGPQVMKGYLDNAAATAATIDSDGWLHTGDIGRFDADGYLYLTDRVKELIKVKGFQVAPAELEAALLAHPGIADAAVIGVPDDAAGEVPMAFVVAAAGESPDLDAIQRFLDGKLAHYKQVQRLEIVGEVPKSASGKILRRVLRERIARNASG